MVRSLCKIKLSNSGNTIRFNKIVLFAIAEKKSSELSKDKLHIKNKQSLYDNIIRNV